MIGKVVCLAASSNIEDVIGIDRFCTGLKMGIEGLSTLSLIFWMLILTLLMGGMYC